jgi:hypothetical protein
MLLLSERCEVVWRRDFQAGPGRKGWYQWSAQVRD